MTPSRVLITGATGFVGGHARAVLERRFPDAAISAFTGDIANPATVLAVIGERKPEAILHLAGVASVPAARAEPDRAFAVNFGGTLNLARAILDLAPECLLINAGSAECYGASFRAGVALNETASLAPLNTYAASKAAADLAIGALVAEAGLRAIRFRPFNHTGRGQSTGFVIAAFAEQITRIVAGTQEPVIRVGNLDAARDFLDVRDVVEAYALAIAHTEDQLPGAIFNLASGTPRRVGDILALMIAASGRTIAIEIDPARLRPVDIPLAFGDATAARDRLGWQPAIEFNDTLRSMLPNPQDL